MGKNPLVENLEKEQLTERPSFDIGDTICVSTKIIEGEKERVQAFQGTVIAKKGRGVSETFSLHRLSYGEGMERIFLLHSPRITKIVVVKKGDVRKAKLYYLRGKQGKAAKIKEKIGIRKMGKDSSTQENESEQTSREALSSTAES